MTDFVPTPATPRITRAVGAVFDPGVKQLLVVDDEETIRLALARFLKSRGYDVQTADSGRAALELLGRDAFHLVVCDVRMPGMTGLDLVPKAIAHDPDLAIVMLTAVNDAPTATEALSRGAMDYLMKPVELADLQQAVERALRRRELTIEQRRVEQLIREEVALRTAELEREKEALRSLTVSVAETLVFAMESKDVYLRGHSQRVGDLAASLADEMGLDVDTVEHVRMAGRLHDIGKIGIRESVLYKPGPLTDEEYQHVKGHVRGGMQILAPLKHLGVALRYVEDHHEHWDGSGYARGLRGPEISVGGRVILAADVYDALTSERPYRPRMEPVAALDLMATMSGKLLDPEIYPVLRRVVERKQALTFL
jgi:putative two-component system response regulator